MGQQSGSQTQTTNPWAPSVPGRTAAINAANSWLASTQAPKAPNKNDYYTTSYGPDESVYNNNGSVLMTKRGSPIRTFNQSAYDQALNSYNTRTYSDPIQDAIRNYQGALQNTPLENNNYNEINKTVSGQYLDGNPYIDTMIGRTNAGVNANFSGAGRYGSGAHAGYLADAGNALRYQNYNDERGRMMQASSLAPQASALRYQPYELGINLAQEMEDIPANRLARYIDLLNAASAGGGSQSTPIYRNRGAGILGGALSGGVGAAMAGASNPWIAAAALAGGAAGGL